MEISNVNLWFAKNQEGKIITIDKANKEDKYICPLCGGEVIPRSLNSEKISRHFAHKNKSECSGESMIHYWVKNELIKKDEVIEVVTNERNQYMIKDIVFEKEYKTPKGNYKPDITITTYTGEEIFVEVNYTNKKDMQDYFDKWSYINNTVLEFSIKNVYNEETNEVSISKTFKSIYYDGINVIDKLDTNSDLRFYNNNKGRYLSFTIHGDNFTLFDNGVIKVNKFNICKVNINNEEDIIKGIEVALSYYHEESCVIPSNIVSIYHKLAKIYNITNNRYRVRLDMNKIVLYISYGSILCSMEYCERTTYEEVIEKFSTVIREYLYGGK